MKIFGKVVDEFNEPIKDAHVYLKNFQSIGDVTNVDGNFIVDQLVIQPTDLITISYIGMETQNIKASELQGAKVILKEDLTQLNEIVVTNGTTNNNSNIATSTIVDNSKNKESFVKKYKKPLSIIGAVAILAASAFIVKKNV